MRVRHPCSTPVPEMSCTASYPCSTPVPGSPRCTGPLLEGLPCVIEPRFSVTHFWERIALFQATQVFLIGAMGVFLWNAAEQEDDAANSLRKAMVVPFPPDLWQAFEARFGLELLTAGLGMSECQLVANQLHAKQALPPYALGYPPEHIDLRLCDDQGNEVADGEAGEICVKPLKPHLLFSGYFDDEAATAAAFRDGYFLTGDMARRDPASGALYFVDRKKDAVRFAGRNISTLEVESVFRRHPRGWRRGCLWHSLGGNRQRG